MYWKEYSHLHGYAGKTLDMILITVFCVLSALFVLQVHTS